ncbi:hypothetical protein [Mucilaginibacter segetis]|uniref:Uncharacterized protein n=1 Tax=Mucilaginibacter segetis TaxID=2793071 RepID=A0A934PTZ0_9SPHI|nr:hypothetical protein [Mucilaginibacter segetis]MBK0379106.1 hypothetical protein [Mucilaginibacter segetis]
MLRINVPTTSSVPLSQSLFDRYNLPHPLNGTDMEISGDMVLIFENEQQAVKYLDELEDSASSVDDDSTEKNILNALITAVNNDTFVRAYLG